MKRVLAGLVFATAFSAVAGNVYYVDANYGSDLNDGLGPGADHACKTLKYVLENKVDAKNGGDTVYAAPGEYKEGICTNSSTYYRAYVPWKTKLIATGRKDETFIIGAKDPDPALDYEGCGPNAVRCCFVGQHSVVKGFTICGGRTTNAGSPLGGGVSGSSGSYVVDCIVSNNASYYRAGGVITTSAVSCYFLDNKAKGGIGLGGQGITLYNCVIGKDATFNTSLLYNCTIASGGVGDRNGDTYNSLFVGSDNGSEKLHRCVLKSGLGSSSTTPENDCLISVKDAGVVCDPTTLMPLPGNRGIDYGRNDKAPNIPATVAELAGLDFNHRQRIYNGTIDCGAVEYDWRDAFGHVLAPARVTVTAADPNVCTNATGGLTVPAGEKLVVRWVYPAGGTGPLAHHFQVTLADGATLHVRRAEGDADLLTVTASGKASFQSDLTEDLVFEAEGGAVAVSAFGDMTCVAIEDSATGLTVTGIDMGVTEILPGQAFDVTVARNFSTAKTCTGIRVNGTFFSFQGETADNLWQKRVANGDDDVRIEAVYAEHNDWYVDASVPNDAGNGRAPYFAKRTLAAASALATEKGDVIHAAPGVYDEGGMAPVDTASYTSNRVALAAGVGLVGAGADVTAIVGKRSTATAAEGGDGKGNGPDALRCVYCRTGSYVRGFTLRGGATNKKAASHDGTAGGGGVLYGAAIDCVVTNNTCGYRGGGGNSVSFIRCRVQNNSSADGTGNDGNTCGYYGCVLSGNYYGGNDVYVNCTLLSIPGVNGGPLSAYNCVVDASASQIAKFNLYNCVCRAGIASSCTTNEFCKVNVGADGVAREDGTYRPLNGAATVDAGDWTFYTNKFPSAYIAFADADFALGARKVGQIDAGAGELDWRTTPSESGLDISVVDNGDGTSTVSVSRNFKSDKLAAGFAFGDETVSFADHPEGFVWQKTLPSEAVLDNSLRLIYADKDWYVDPVNGDDANKGYLPIIPKKTLVAALAVAPKGSVVHAAPGVYAEGEIWDANASNRVCVGEGRGLVSDQGPEVTTILGYSSPSTDNGIGPDAVRCVSLKNGAWIQGFTLTGGRTPADGTVHPGGGGITSSGGAVVDCVITNNGCGYRGGGIDGGTYIRCLMRDNGKAGSYPNYMISALVDSVLEGSVYTGGMVLNCVLGNGSELFGNSMSPCYNSFVWSEDGGWTYTNCFFRIAKLPVKDGSNRKQSTADPETCRFSQVYADNFDADYRPKPGAPVIDAGNRALYDERFPAEWRQFKTDLGRSGGQRVYNARIDLGADEYDWRGSFAATLAKKGAEVSAASPGVTTNAVAGLDVAAGESLKLKLVLKADGKASFKVVAEDGAEAAVTAGGEPVMPGEYGAYEFEGVAGETDVEIAVTGEGKATVSDVILPKRGMLLLVR